MLADCDALPPNQRVNAWLTQDQLSRSVAPPSDTAFPPFGAPGERLPSSKGERRWMIAGLPVTGSEGPTASGWLVLEEEIRLSPAREGGELELAVFALLPAAGGVAEEPLPAGEGTRSVGKPSAT